MLPRVSQVPLLSYVNLELYNHPSLRLWQEHGCIVVSSSIARPYDMHRGLILEMLRHIRKKYDKTLPSFSELSEIASIAIPFPHKREGR